MGGAGHASKLNRKTPPSALAHRSTPGAGILRTVCHSGATDAGVMGAPGREDGGFLSFKSRAEPSDTKVAAARPPPPPATRRPGGLPMSTAVLIDPQVRIAETVKKVATIATLP